MPDIASPKQEAGSMEELVADLQKPFEMKVQSGEVPPGEITPGSKEDITPDVTPKGKEAPEQKEGLKTPKDKIEKPTSRELLESLNKFGEKNIKLGDKKEEVKPSETKPLETTKVEPKERDYSGFSEAEIPYLKRMSNEAFDYVTKELRESRDYKTRVSEEIKAKDTELTNLRQGKVVIPENYYENPDAVVLTPEFSKAQDNYTFAQQEHSHWATQLANLEKGENWTDLTTNKDGQKVYGQTYAAGPEARAHVLRQLNMASNMEIKRQGELENVVANFQTNSTNYRNKIAEAEKTYMPYFEDKNSEAYKTYQQIVPEVEKFGISSKNPAFTMLAKSIALNFMFRDLAINAQNELNKSKTLKDDKVKAGPNGNEIGGGANPPAQPKPKLSFSDMNKEINRLM